MPEGHVIHILARDLNHLFAGRRVSASSPQGRFEQGAARIDGCELVSFEAYGKHLVGYFDGLIDVLHIHLGLFGKIALEDGRSGASNTQSKEMALGSEVAEAMQDDEVIIEGAGGVKKRPKGSHGSEDTVRLRLTAFKTCGAPSMELRGPTACELLTPPELAKLLDRIGPDPLDPDADPDRAWAKIHKSAKPIGELLMDQGITSGVGNIYRAELLFRFNLDPWLPGKSLDRETWDAMWLDLVELMRYGFDHGRIDTVRPEHTPEAMNRPPRVDAHGGEVYVYRREGQPCHVCGTPVLEKNMAGRNIFWCPTCQRR